MNQVRVSESLPSRLRPWLWGGVGIVYRRTLGHPHRTRRNNRAVIITCMRCMPPCQQHAPENGRFAPQCLVASLPMQVCACNSIYPRILLTCMVTYMKVKDYITFFGTIVCMILTFIGFYICIYMSLTHSINEDRQVSWRSNEFHENENLVYTISNT